MTLPNKCKIARADNGIVVNLNRAGTTAWFDCNWQVPDKDGTYQTRTGTMEEQFIERKIKDGTYMLLTDDRYSNLPSKFYFTTSTGKRYTAYCQDDFITVAEGEGIRTEVANYPADVVWDYINDGYWKVLAESYRSPSSVAVEFMEYINSQGEIVSEDDRTALAQTIILLNKVMYGKVSGIDD